MYKRQSTDTAVAGLIGTHQGRGLSTYASELLDSVSSFDVYREPDGINVHGWTSTAGLIGYAPAMGLIDNCHATGDVTGYFSVGGFLGYQNPLVVRDSTASGQVTGVYGVGGFAGATAGGGGLTATLINLSASGDVTGDTHVGGFIGLLFWTTDVENSSASGDVHAEVQNAGGFIGYIHTGLNLVRDNLSSGNVSSAGNNAGGFVGLVNNEYDHTAALQNNLTVSPSVSAETNRHGFAGTIIDDTLSYGNFFYSYEDGLVDLHATGLDTADLTNPLSYNGWDFETTWTIPVSDGGALVSAPHPVLIEMCDGEAIVCD